MRRSRVMLAVMVAFLVGFIAGALAISAGSIDRQALASLQRENDLLRQQAELLTQELNAIHAILERPAEAEPDATP